MGRKKNLGSTPSSAPAQRRTTRSVAQRTHEELSTGIPNPLKADLRKKRKIDSVLHDQPPPIMEYIEVDDEDSEVVIETQRPEASQENTEDLLEQLGGSSPVLQQPVPSSPVPNSAPFLDDTTHEQNSNIPMPNLVGSRVSPFLNSSHFLTFSRGASPSPRGQQEQEQPPLLDSAALEDQPVDLNYVSPATNASSSSFLFAPPILPLKVPDLALPQFNTNKPSSFSPFSSQQQASEFLRPSEIGLLLENRPGQKKVAPPLPPPPSSLSSSRLVSSKPFTFEKDTQTAYFDLELQLEKEKNKKLEEQVESLKQQVESILRNEEIRAISREAEVEMEREMEKDKYDKIAQIIEGKDAEIARRDARISALEEEARKHKKTANEIKNQTQDLANAIFKFQKRLTQGAP